MGGSPGSAAALRSAMAVTRPTSPTENRETPLIGQQARYQGRGRRAQQPGRAPGPCWCGAGRQATMPKAPKYERKGWEASKKSSPIQMHLTVSISPRVERLKSGWLLITARPPPPPPRPAGDHRARGARHARDGLRLEPPGRSHGRRCRSAPAAGWAVGPRRPRGVTRSRGRLEIVLCGDACGALPSRDIRAGLERQATRLRNGRGDRRAGAAPLRPPSGCVPPTAHPHGRHAFSPLQQPEPRRRAG